MSNHETKCPTCYGPVDAAGHAITLGSAFVEIAKLQNQLDLMRDEFTRIRNIASHPLSVISKEVVGICDRAVSDITQHVSVIAQRDEALSARDAAIEREAGLREALADAEPFVMMWAAHYAKAYEVTKVSSPGPDDWHPTHRDIYYKIERVLKGSTPGPAMPSHREILSDAGDLLAEIEDAQSHVETRRLLHESDVAGRIREALKATSGPTLASVRAEAVREDIDAEEIIAFLAGEISAMPCMHRDGNHDATPPMMWPELIRCIANRRAHDAIREASRMVGAKILPESESASGLEEGLIRLRNTVYENIAAELNTFAATLDGGEGQRGAKP